MRYPSVGQNFAEAPKFDQLCGKLRKKDEQRPEGAPPAKLVMTGSLYADTVAEVAGHSAP